MSEAPRERGRDLESNAPQLFLSHSSKDEEIVSRLAENLNTCGVDVWLDTWEVRVGTDLHQRIAEAIHKSRFVAVVVSRHFSDSKWIQGEVNQALSREKTENRVVVLPLLAEDLPLPPVLSNKKFLDLCGDNYYPTLVRLAGLIHDLGPDSIEAGIRSKKPIDVSGCVEALRYCGFEPFCIVGKRTLKEIEEAGGRRSGNRVHFDPREILDSPDISPALRDLMKRLTKERGL